MRPLIGTVVGAHPLAGTVLELVWLLPLLPLLGFLINGLLALLPVARPGPSDPDPGHDAQAAHGAHDAHPAGAHAADAHVVSAGGAHGDEHHLAARHRYATLVSVIGPAVLAGSFVLALLMVFQMAGGGDAAAAPCIQAK